MKRLIDNTTIVTLTDAGVLAGQAVVIDGARIAAVGPSAELRALHPDADLLDGGGRLLMPGFTNPHMHFYGMYARGMSLNRTPHNFHEILQYLWWALDKVLDDEAVYYSALIPTLSAVRHGVTSIIDHHASPNACAGSLDQIERALAEVGMRGLLCYEVSDRDGPAIRDAGLAENARYIRRCQAARANDPDHLFDGMMGLHASFTLEDATLVQAVGLADDLDRGCHIHVLEDLCDETLTREATGRGVIDRLADARVLGPRSIAAHAIFLDEATRARLAATGCVVVHQAQSNMNNAVGRADVFALLDAGVTVGLGTDGMSADVRREAMTGYLMHKHHVSDNNLGWVEFEQMLLHNNPAIYTKLTGQPVGRVAPGYMADLILVDYQAPTPLSADNFWGHFLFGLVDATVDTTIINGRVVMRHGEIAGIDEAAIAARSRAVAERVWARYRASA